MIRIFMIGYSSNKGGVENYIENLCGHLDKTKFEIVYKDDQIVIDGVTWMCPKNRHNYLKYRIFWHKFYKANKFDVVYYNTCDVVSIDQLKFATNAGIPVRIIHAHNTGNQQNIQQKMSHFHRISEYISRKSLKRYATHFFACSKSAGDWMFGEINYRVIANGIDLCKFKYSKENRIRCRELYQINSEYVIGCVGRFSLQKNPLFSIDIMNTLLKIIPNAKLVMIGTGELHEDIVRAIKAKNIQNNVILTGAVDNVNEWMSALDCLLMPSLFEGLPFVLVEAQAAGLPCVVSSTVSREANLTGIVEYLELTERTDIWANKILEACRKERLDTTQQLIDAGYSVKDTARLVSSIIETAVEEIDLH